MSGAARRRPLLPLALLVCATALLPGCRRSEAAHAARENTFVIAHCCDEYVLNPTTGETAQFLAFSPLIGEDRRTKDFLPSLARRWEHSGDFRSWTFHLRSDARWHDGQPVTARDVLFTARLLAHPAVEIVDPADETFAASDDSTFTVRYTKPNGAGEWTWNVIYPEHLLKDLDPGQFATWSFWTHPVGSGPYRYVRHTPKTMMEFERNPDYFGKKPAIQRVVLKFAGQAGLSELLSGNADALQEVSRTDALRLERDPRFRLYRSFQPRLTLAIFWRYDHPLFNDVRVRRALTLALDRRALLRLLDLPSWTPIADGFYSERQFYGGNLPPALPYDTAQARRLLAEAGWRDSDGDGVLDRNGRPFRFVFRYRGGWYGTDQAPVFVQDQLRRIGVAVDLQPSPGAGQDYDAALIGYNIYNPRYLFSKESGSHYDNARFLTLAAALDSAVAPGDAERIFGQLTEIFRADQPATPLFPLSFATAVHRRVKGLEDLYAADVVWDIERLHLEGGLR